MFKGIKLPSKLGHAGTNDFFLNTGKPKHSQILFFFFFWLPLLPTTGTIWRSLLSSPILPLQSFFTWGKPHLPLQRCVHPGLRNPRALHPPLWFCHHYDYVHTLCLDTISFCPTTPGLSMRRSLRILHIYS